MPGLVVPLRAQGPFENTIDIPNINGIKVRKHHIWYFPSILKQALRRLGLDTDPGDRRPQDQQLVLLNRDIIHEDHG